MYIDGCVSNEGPQNPIKMNDLSKPPSHPPQFLRIRIFNHWNITKISIKTPKSPSFSSESSKPCVQNTMARETALQ